MLSRVTLSLDVIWAANIRQEISRVGVSPGVFCVGSPQNTRS